MLRRCLLILSLLLIMYSATMGLRGDGAARAAQTWTVQVGDNYFSPRVFTVNVGDTVVWTNMGAQIHTTTADGGQAVYWNSGDLQPGKSFSYAFAQAGNFTYNCFYHPEMVAEVDVLQPVPEFPGYLVYAILGFAVALALLFERSTKT